MSFVFYRLIVVGRDRFIVERFFLYTECRKYLFLVHPYPVVGHIDFHIVVLFHCIDSHTSPFGREFPGIIGYGVDHEERQYPVGFHPQAGWVDL